MARNEVGPRRSRANSSAGSERLPYTQDVGGSNPSSPICTRVERGAVPGPRGPSCWGDRGMYRLRLVLIALIGVVPAVPAAAQGIPRGARTQTVNAAPRLMVANPFAFASADSATAVKIGSAAREEMKGIAGRNFNVVEQAQMNDALKQYGYTVDAILSPPLATTLAKNIQARVLMSGTMARGAGGRTSVTARLTGVNDDAGNVVTQT